MSALAQLVVLNEGRVAQTLPLAQAIVGIGSDASNAVTLPHAFVAARHAELRHGCGAVLLVDLGSESGTYLDGARLEPHTPQRIDEGSLARIGPYALRVQPPGAQPLAPHTNATGPQSRYTQDLPLPFHGNDFLARMLLIYETLWEPLEQRQDQIALFFDPRTCPAALLPWLARWVGLDTDLSWGEGRLRQLLLAAPELCRTRGTSVGLERAIRILTGLAPQIEADPQQPFLIRVRVAATKGQAVDRALLEQVIVFHKPAHVGYTIELTDTPGGTA